MPITYDSATNTITIVGTKDGQPYTFEDIYQADVNNGWGKFTKLSEGVYKTTAKLQFGNGTTETLFEDKAVTLIIDNVSDVNSDDVFLFKANANVVFGEKATSTDGFDNYQYGCTFVIHNTLVFEWNFKAEEGSNVCLYNCAVKILANRCNIKGYFKEIKACQFETLVRDLNGTVFEYNVITGSRGYLENIAENVTVNDVFIKTTVEQMVWCVNNNAKFTNIRGSSANRLANVYRLQSPNIAKFVNCKPHNWKVNWYLAEGDISGEIQRVYAVVFKVTDVNGNPLANREIKVYDKNGNKVAEAVTNSNGLTPEVEILYAKLTNPYADNTWHTFTDDDWEYFNPFTVEVYYGNELEYKGIITELNADMLEIPITAKPSSVTLNDIMNKIEYIRKLFGNRWKIENNQLLIYDDDNATVIRRYNLYDKEGNPTEVSVYDRIPTE